MVKSVQIHPLNAAAGPAGVAPPSSLNGKPERQGHGMIPSAAAAAATHGNSLHPQNQLAMAHPRGASIPYVYPNHPYRGSHSTSSRSQQQHMGYHRRNLPRPHAHAHPYPVDGSFRPMKNLPPHPHVVDRGAYPSHPGVGGYPTNHPFKTRHPYLEAQKHNPELPYTKAQMESLHRVQFHSSTSYHRSEENFPVPNSSRNPHIPSHPSFGFGKPAKDPVVRVLPLHTVEMNKQENKKEIIAGVKKTTNPPQTVAKDQKQRALKSIQSPVTMCFERMLGAAKYLANNPTPDHVKKHLAQKTNGAADSVAESKGEDETEITLKRKSDDIEKGSDDKFSSEMSKPKRIRGLKPLLPTGQHAETLNSLGEDNPFVQLLNDEDLYHQVILQMTLEADSKETKKPGDREEPVSNVINGGFYWRDYPELEEILYANMEAYYNMSSNSRQSRFQQSFNNELVATIREVAKESGYSFDPLFNDRRLRDRVRCFYKTHVQNAKKRLATMQKHPNSVMNQTQLRAWIELAKQQPVAEQETSDEKETMT